MTPLARGVRVRGTGIGKPVPGRPGGGPVEAGSEVGVAGRQGTDPGGRPALEGGGVVWLSPSSAHRGAGRYGLGQGSVGTGLRTTRVLGTSPVLRWAPPGEPWCLVCIFSRRVPATMAPTVPVTRPSICGQRDGQSGSHACRSASLLCTCVSHWPGRRCAGARGCPGEEDERARLLKLLVVDLFWAELPGPRDDNTSESTWRTWRHPHVWTAAHPSALAGH